MKPQLLILLALLQMLLPEAQSQSTRIPMDLRMEPTTIDTLVAYTLELTESELPHYSAIIYNRDRTIKARGRYVLENKKWLEDGHFVFFHGNGTVESEGFFDRGIKVGEWRRFDAKGIEKVPRYYDPEAAEQLRALQKPVTPRQ